MKTNIRTILTLGLVGVLGLTTNAATLKSASSNFEKSEFSLALLNDEATVDFRGEAMMLTKLTADKEEAKATQKLIEAGFQMLNETAETTEANSESAVSNLDESGVVDYLMEAQILAKKVADNEEAKAVQKLVKEGKIAENK